MQCPAPTACRYTVSGTLSLPSQGVFSPFPHGTGSLSVAKEYLALRDGPRRFPQDFTCPVVLRIPGPRLQLSPTGFSPSTMRLSSALRLASCGFCQVLQPRRHPKVTPVWALSLSLAATPEIDLSLSLPSGTEMVHFPEFASSSL